MAVSLSIKNVPDDVVALLRDRAERHHRSLQGELLDIVVREARFGSFDAAAFMAESERLQTRAPADIHAVLAEIRAMGLNTPDEATAMIREDRDSDHGRH